MSEQSKTFGQMSPEERTAAVRAAMARMSEPTAEQLAALALYAQVHGRHWRAALAQDWYYACERIHQPALRAVRHHLQRLRNDFGPDWLVGFTFPTDREARRHPRLG